VNSGRELFRRGFKRTPSPALFGCRSEENTKIPDGTIEALVQGNIRLPTEELACPADIRLALARIVGREIKML
jgi:hypothetical protein